MTIKLDPNTGMYVVPELMEQGPVPQPHNFRPSPDPQGPDTVRADLTPGEAVIPAPVAQDPAYKPAIEQMVAEGRGRNDAMRGGTTDVPGFMGGTHSVPAYNQGEEEISDFGQEGVNPFDLSEILSQVPEPPKVNLRTGRVDPVYENPNAGKVYDPGAGRDTAEFITPEEATRREGEFDLAKAERLQPKRGRGIVPEKPEEFEARKAEAVAAAEAKIATPDVPAVGEDVPTADVPTDTLKQEIPDQPGATHKIVMPDGTVVQGQFLDDEEPQNIAAAYQKGLEIPEEEREKAGGFFSNLWEKAFGYKPEGKDRGIGLLTFAGAMFAGIAAGPAILLAAGAAANTHHRNEREDERLETAAAAKAKPPKPTELANRVYIPGHGEVQSYNVDGENVIRSGNQWVNAAEAGAVKYDEKIHSPTKVRDSIGKDLESIEKTINTNFDTEEYGKVSINKPKAAAQGARLFEDDLIEYGKDPRDVHELRGNLSASFDDLYQAKVQYRKGNRKRDPQNDVEPFYTKRKIKVITGKVVDSSDVENTDVSNLQYLHNSMKAQSTGQDDYVNDWKLAKRAFNKLTPKQRKAYGKADGWDPLTDFVSKVLRDDDVAIKDLHSTVGKKSFK